MRLPRSSVVSSLAALLLLVGCPGPGGSDGGTDAGGDDSGQPVTPAFTVHYHRSLADYTGWAVTTSAGASEATAAQSGTDGWGATYALTVTSGASTLSFTLNNGSATETAPFNIDVSGSIREVWIVSGFKTPITSRPPAIPGANQVAVYYKRSDTSYTGWGLHVWGDQVVGTSWGTPLPSSGVNDVIGAGFLVDTPKGQPAGSCAVGQLCLIVHKGDTKDPGPDMGFDPKVLGNIVFVLSGSSTITATPRIPGAVDISGASAHLLRRNTLVWNFTADAGTTYELRYSPTADIKATTTDVVGGAPIPLAPAGGIEPILAAQRPQLSTFAEYTLDAGDLSTIKQALKGQLVAVARNPDGGVISATAVQTGFALDDLYAYDGPLGVTFDGGAPTIALWAPSAQAVKLTVFDAAKTVVETHDLTEGEKGVWSYAGPAAWKNDYYQYTVQVYHPATSKVETLVVSDPYSANVSTNGQYTQIVDLTDPALMPTGWTTFTKPALAAPEDIVVYESHVRDFSATDPSVPGAVAGKFLAFSTPAADGGLTQGQAHLKALAQAGLTHVHVLPAFDFATVDEDPANRVDLGDQFSTLCAKNSAVPAATCTQFAGKTILEAYQSFDGGSDQQQLIASYLYGLDSFNWGYDPFHYGALEGSYASTAEGTAKIVEFRQLVMGLSALGLRTVMDVVYNHTNASGPASPKSVLDKVVPGYYHRLDPVTGSVDTSSCCANTASERHMMERLMVDTLVRFARDFKVDGFRFDLMGLHFVSNLQTIQGALAALTPAADGVDGSKIYLYGEGWDMGELAGGAWGQNANQLHMAGTGIGTFNDRLRDGVRGGGPFDNASQFRLNQGFSSGLYLDPNELSDAGVANHDLLLVAGDLIKVGMAGGLAEFKLQRALGSIVTANTIGYNGARAGYTQDPQETINYVSAHDNQTLWDIMAYKFPTGTSIADRVRGYDVALDTVLLGEGIPFFHLGDDILRSKSMEKDSYDSGDWFNQVDWSLSKNGWRMGLPNAGKDSGNWSTISPIFDNANAMPSATDIATASAHFQTMLKVRKSSPLFRLQTKADVMKRVDFTNTGPSQLPGVVAMTLTDGTCAGTDLDPTRDSLVVIINADKVAHDVVVTGAMGGTFTLHTALQASSDAVVKTAAFASGTGTFTVPARTSAVFEQLQSGAQGEGLPCNTK